jgi:glutathione synthase/RimK-type ligase-like ATP-grasp enzyme
VTQPRIALATSSALPELEVDDRTLVPALAERGITAEPVVWDDPAVDWSVYDLVLIRSTWDYTARPAEFLAWTRTVESVSRLVNPAAAVAWNVDKQYQRALESAGLPIIPTIWLDPERNFDSRAIHTRFPAFGDFVIKPTISTGSRDTGRYNAGETPSRALAITHAKSLLTSGRHVMVQRYLKQVDAVGETARVFIDGQFSHAVRKAPQLEGPFRAGDAETDTVKHEVMTAREASAEELAVAQRVVAALPELVDGLDGPLLYARVDLVPDDAGHPVVLELALTEPSFFFSLAEGSVDRFADAIAARL